jgi:hypothetical protein
VRAREPRRSGSMDERHGRDCPEIRAAVKVCLERSIAIATVPRGVVVRSSDRTPAGA